MHSKLNLSILGWKASSEMCDILTAEPGGGGRAMALLIKEQPGAFTSASEGASWTVVPRISELLLMVVFR